MDILEIPLTTSLMNPLYAVQSFARDNNLRILGYASGNMIYHLNRAIEELAATQIVVDTQLETAIDMAKAISQ